MKNESVSTVQYNSPKQGATINFYHNKNQDEIVHHSDFMSELFILLDKYGLNEKDTIITIEKKPIHITDPDDWRCIYGSCGK